MREIRFRGKYTHNNKWLYGDLLQYADAAQIWVQTDNGKWNYKVIPETVGQYTGLKDKNGTEIYEGDVVWCRAGEHERGIWEYEKRFIVEYGWSESMWEMSMCDEIEVIGNIYENPELLGGTE